MTKYQMINSIENQKLLPGEYRIYIKFVSFIAVVSTTAFTGCLRGCRLFCVVELLVLSLAINERH